MTTIGESPLDPRVLYTGMDDGTVQVTRDGGETWTNITSRITGLPPHTVRQHRARPRALPSGRVYALVRRTLQRRLQAVRLRKRRLRADVAIARRRLARDVHQPRSESIRASPHVLILAHEKGVHISNDDGADLDAAVAGDEFSHRADR